MVRNGEAVEAHMWSASTGSWNNVGQVVDAVGPSNRRLHDGKEYDFVFDVDIQEGAPPLKLPYNVSENPFEAARRFLENNELPISYLDTVGNFIVKNSQGVSLGEPSQPSGPVADPFGIESRYRPGETSSPAPSKPNHPKILPQKEYLSITTTNLSLVEKKIEQINQELVQTGQKELSLNPTEMGILRELCQYLQTRLADTTSKAEPPLPAPCLSLLRKLISSLSPQHRLPVLDLLRLVASVSPSVAQMNLVDLFTTSGTMAKEHPNNVMLAVRAFVNLFQTEEGRGYVQKDYERVCGTSRAGNGV
jgi:phospholipase A-2-activating protein